MYKRNILENNIIGDTMKIKEIMTKDVHIGNIDQSIIEVANILKKEDIGFLPIAMDRKIIGVITDRDLACILKINPDLNSKIESYITENPITIEEDLEVIEALQLMKEKKVKRLLVVKERKLKGVISLSDLFHTDLSDEELMKAIRCIFEISKSTDKETPEIDEFYL